MSPSFHCCRPRPRSSAGAGSKPCSRRLLAAMETWLIRRQGWQDLNELDDHLLNDIGIVAKRSRFEECTGKPF